MRKLVTALACMTFLLLFTCAGAGQAAADTAIRLYLDGKLLQPEVSPRLVGEGTTLVPVRIISEELGAEVSWHQPEKRVTIEQDGRVIKLYIGMAEAVVDGITEKLDAAPLLVDGNTLIPVRFVTENMGLEVQWDPLTHSVSLLHSAEAIPVSETPSDAPSAIPAGAKPATPTPSPSPTPSASASSSTVKPSASSSASPTPKSSTAASTSKPSATPKSSSSPSPSASASTGPGSGTGGKLPIVNQISLDDNVLKIEAEGGSIEPKVTHLSSPERLVIDVPNAALGKTMNGEAVVQNGELTLSNSYISKVRYALFQDNPSTVRIVVDLKQKIEYTLLESKNPGEYSLSLKAFQYIVLLDAGHGGHDPGAISISGNHEKDFNLAVILKVAALLEENPLINVHLTRSDDTFVELDDRVAIANELAADIFVSVHANKYDKSSISGSETYYWREESKELAQVLHKRILAAAKLPDRGVRTADFRVITKTVMPAVLCEIGYLSNPDDEALLFDEEFQARTADAIAAGIKEYLQIP